MNFAKFRRAILGILGIEDFSAENGHYGFNDAERDTLRSYGFADSFIAGFENYLNEPEAAASAEEPRDSRSAVLQGLLQQATERVAEAEAELSTLRTAAGTHAADIAARENTIAQLRERVAQLAALPEQDPGANAGSAGAAPQGADLSNTTQLGGLPGEMYSLDRGYNSRARAALLARQGVLVQASSSVDYSTLQADLGAFYRIPWLDRVQSFLTLLPSIEDIFPLESGYQDLATLVNVWLGEFSQADNTKSEFDRVTKGSYEFGDETLRMYSVMFSHSFTNLKDLERTWIGSLNKEGSQVIKWSFIEFLLAETAKKLHNEREQRRVNGVRKDPDVNKPGRAMEAADGFYEIVRKYIEGRQEGSKTVYQVKPFELGEITPGNIGDIIYNGTSQVPSHIRDTGNLRLYLPSFMIAWYQRWKEAHYGRNTNYDANEMFVHEYPAVKIVPVPNADNHHRLVWTLDGNFHTYEDVAGEMYNFQIQQITWSLKVWSNWKEGLAAIAVGYKYTDKSEMDGSRQLIWANEYDRPSTSFIEAEPDANPDVTTHTSVVTVANSEKLYITDITGAEVGQIVTIKCGNADPDKGVGIKTEGKFSLLSTPWAPAKNDVIKLMKRADGKFIEVARYTESSQAYQFAANATTPSVAGANVFITDANTGTTAITNLADAVVGETYTIYGAGSTNASTIANSGKFVLTAAMTLSAGASIQLVAAADGKFYEIARVTV